MSDNNTLVVQMMLDRQRDIEQLRAALAERDALIAELQERLAARD